MNLTFKFDARKENIFYSSDFHGHHAFFGQDVLGEKHTPIWKLRGYSSCHEMNEHIISETNRLVKPEDHFIFHGDLTLRCSVEETEEFLARFNCQNIYILFGNHESFTGKIYERERDKLNLPFRAVYPLRYKNVIFCGPQIMSFVRWGENKRDTVIITHNHFPLAIWDYMKDSSWCLTAHSHMGFKDTHPETTTCGKIADIGWDYKRRPLSFWEVKELMDKKPILKKDANH